MMLLVEGSAVRSWADALTTWPTANKLARMLVMVTVVALFGIFL